MQKSPIEPEVPTPREARAVVVAHVNVVARVNAVDLAIVIAKAVARNVAATKNEAEAAQSPESSNLQRWVSELPLSLLPSATPIRRISRTKSKTVVAAPGIGDNPLALSRRKWMMLETPDTGTRGWLELVPPELPWLLLLNEHEASLVVAETNLAPRAGFVKDSQLLRLA